MDPVRQPQQGQAALIPEGHGSSRWHGPQNLQSSSPVDLACAMSCNNCTVDNSSCSQLAPGRAATGVLLDFRGLLRDHRVPAAVWFVRLSSNNPGTGSVCEPSSQLFWPVPTKEATNHWVGFTKSPSPVWPLEKWEHAAAVLWVSIFYAAVPNGTCKQGWGQGNWGRFKPINLTLASVTHMDGLMMRTCGTLVPYLSLSWSRTAVALNGTCPWVPLFLVRRP
jgi:hypothetical protein